MDIPINEIIFIFEYILLEFAFVLWTYYFKAISGGEINL